MMGSGKTEESEDQEEARNVSGANETERIRKTDFSKLNAIDSQMLEELALKLFQQMSKRIKKKMKNSTKKNRERGRRRNYICPIMGLSLQRKWSLR